jgi:hypothetical protein
VPIRLGVVVAVAALVGAPACAPKSVTYGSDDNTVTHRAPRPPGPHEPRVSAQGSDLSDLPEAYPDGEWLPIDAPLLDMSVYVQVTLDGARARAMLDTGAMGTTMSTPLAEKLGIVGDGAPRGKPIRAIDAHGNAIMGERVPVGEVRIGRHRWVDVEVTVLGDQPDLLLIGADLLRDVDLFIAGDEGLVGVFEGGHGPREDTDLVVHVQGGDRQLLVVGESSGTRGPVPFRLIVDTGAWNTSVPLIAGINGGLPADTAFEAVTVAVGGEQENRGRFVLDPLRLGEERVPVGRVLAIGSTLEHDGGMGLLGNDVLMRRHTLISFKSNEIRFKEPAERPAQRTRGPGGRACTDTAGAQKPCLAVELVEHKADNFDASDLPDVCMQIHVDKSYANKTLELAVTGKDGDLFNGGAIRAFVTANDDGAQWCSHVWKQLDHLGVSAGTPLSLRWVRTEGIQWPCDPMKTRCITFTGPLAKLLTKN